MRNLRFPFGRDVGAQAQSYMQHRGKRRRVREILARRQKDWRLLAWVTVILSGAAAVASLLSHVAHS
jgi:hypothetical protein